MDSNKTDAQNLSKQKKDGPWKSRIFRFKYLAVQLRGGVLKLESDILTSMSCTTHFTRVDGRGRWRWQLRGRHQGCHLQTAYKWKTKRGIGGNGNGRFTLPETNSLPLKIGLPNRKVVFQPSIFRGYVSFREGR